MMPRATAFQNETRRLKIASIKTGPNRSASSLLNMAAAVTEMAIVW